MIRVLMSLTAAILCPPRPVCSAREDISIAFTRTVVARSDACGVKGVTITTATKRWAIQKRIENLCGLLDVIVRCIERDDHVDCWDHRDGRRPSARGGQNLIKARITLKTA